MMAWSSGCLKLEIVGLGARLGAEASSWALINRGDLAERFIVRKFISLIFVFTLFLLFFSITLLIDPTHVQAQAEATPPETAAITATVTATASPTATVAAAPTLTATVTLIPTAVTSPTLTVTPAPSITATTTLTATPTPTVTVPVISPTPVVTVSLSPTATVPPPLTATLTPSPAPPTYAPRTASLTIYLPLILRAEPDLVDQNLTGLVGYWRLDESTGKRIDNSGRGNHLANSGVRSGSGQTKQAADFERNEGDYLSISDGSQRGLDIPGDLTLAGWLNLESHNSTDQVIAAKYSFGGSLERRAYRLDVRDNGSRLGFIVSPNGKFSSSYLLEARLPAALQTGRWYFVAAVFAANTPQAGRSTMTIYLDGQAVGSKTVGFTQPHNSNAPFMLGADLENNSPAQFFDGKLDEWRIYHGVLSQSQIRELRDSAPAPAPGPTPTSPPSADGDNAACNPSNGSGGLAAGTITEIQLNGLRTSLVVGDGYKPSTPTYLVFLLHGDEGNYSFTQKPTNTVTQLVKERGWILIQPESPEAQTRWWKDPDPQAQRLKGAFDVMFRKYNLCRNVILGGAWSGGSIFWTKNFFTSYGTIYPAHTLMLCGAGRPSATTVNLLGNNASVVARSSFKFTYGSKDHLYEGIQVAISVYRGAGFKVVKNELAGVGHCVPGISDKFRSFLIAKSAELKIN